MSHVTGMNESCHVVTWSPSGAWHQASFVNYTASIHMNESWHTCTWVMSHTCMSHVTYTWVMSHMSHITHRDPIDVGSVTLGLIRDRITLLAHIWTSHGTHTHDSCHTYARVMLHIETWTPSGAWQLASFVTELLSWQTYEWVMSHICMSHVTHRDLIAVGSVTSGLFRDRIAVVGVKVVVWGLHLLF